MARSERGNTANTTGAICRKCRVPGTTGQHKRRSVIECPDCGDILVRPF